MWNKIVQCFQVKLQKLFKIRLTTNSFYINIFKSCEYLSIVADKHLYVYIIFILGELSVCCQ